MDKKAQIQTMETILVLFVFFILLALAMIFYVAYSNSQSERNLINTMDILSGELALTVSNLPELHSSQQGVGGINNLDSYKIQALYNVISSDEDARLVYISRFGESKIIIKEIYPSQKNWTVYDNSPENTEEIDFVRPFFIPITIHEPSDNLNSIGKNVFGILEVWYYG